MKHAWVFLSLVLCVWGLSSCSTFNKQGLSNIQEYHADPKKVNSHKIMVVGCIRFNPEITYERPINTDTGEVEIARDPLIYLLLNNSDYVTKPYADLSMLGIYVRQAQTFMVPVDNTKTTYLRGFGVLINEDYAYSDTTKSSYVSFAAEMWGSFKIEVPADAKAIYIGTISLGRNRQYESEGFKVIDEYDTAKQDFQALYPGIELVRADMTFMDSKKKK